MMPGAGMLGGGLGGFGMGIGWLFSILFWGLLIVAAMAVVRWLSAHEGRTRAWPSSPDTGDSALEILRRRYARGEIDRDEFEAKKRDLVA
jgi:putative membrane protein